MKTLFFGWLIAIGFSGAPTTTVVPPAIFDNALECREYRAQLTKGLKNSEIIKSFSLTCRPYSMVDGSYPEGDRTNRLIPAPDPDIGPHTTPWDELPDN